MSDIRFLRRKMKTVSGIQQITKAMKMVASVKIKKAEKKMKAARPYAQKYQELVAELTGQLDEIVNPLMEVRIIKKTCLLIITSDKGLCGSYNSNILRESEKFLKVNSDKKFEITLFGLKGVRAFTRKKIKLEKYYTFWEPAFELARQIAGELKEKYIARKIDEVICLYNYPQSTMVQTVKQLQILPFLAPEKKVKPRPVLFEPAPRLALAQILPKFLEVILYQVLLEAKAAELSSRLKAMTNATDNAQELLSELRLQYFRARQEAITNEILEITGSAEALRR